MVQNTQLSSLLRVISHPDRGFKLFVGQGFGSSAFGVGTLDLYKLAVVSSQLAYQ